MNRMYQLLKELHRDDRFWNSDGSLAVWNFYKVWTQLGLGTDIFLRDDLTQLLNDLYVNERTNHELHG